MIDIQKFTPRKSPEPNRPFVNRVSELNLIQTKVNTALRGDPVHLAITCFWGPFGMGKSWLMRELERRYQFSGLREAGGSKPTVTARLDLNQKASPTLWEGHELIKENLIRQLWKQIADQINVASPNLEQASPEEWTSEFIAQATTWSSDYIILIMLDTVDDLIKNNESSFFWLEQSLIERLILTGKVLLVFTSRGELRTWKRFQVRQRVETHRLTAFDAETAGKEINSNSQDTSQLIFEHAFGHPLVTDYVSRLLQNDEHTTLITGSNSENIDIAAVREVLQAVVTEIFNPLEEPIAKVAKYISILRWVSAESLRSLIEKLDASQLGRGDVYFLDQIASLQSNHLLYWNSSQKNYELDTVLRHIITHFLEIDDLHLFGLANSYAFTFHLEHLEKYPQYLARYIPELVFHRALLKRCTLLDSQPITFQKWWETFLATKSSEVSTDAWKELLVRLKNDDELCKLANDEYTTLLSYTEEKSTQKTV